MCNHYSKQISTVKAHLAALPSTLNTFAATIPIHAPPTPEQDVRSLEPAAAAAEAEAWREKTQ